ncbi:TRAP transporter substrate-binding protein DctP [Enemella sp. A6]|uniref:TRAP transporter substrate-binding protein DctP n=1 Tax=Enemella sp. A6 TaxID=3440152 RepID=UPI003EBA0455
MKKRWAVTIAGALAGALALSACGGGGGAGGGGDDGEREEVTLTFVTGFPEKLVNNQGFWMFRDKLKENAPWVTIDYRGGPEVIPPNQMMEGVSSGAYDGAHMPGDYYVSQLPAMDLQRFTPFTPAEERENGVADLWQQVHEPLGLHYVGHTHSGIPQIIFLKDKIDKPDLSGKSIRTSPATSYMVRAMGGTPVEMPGAEVYTALERNVVQGSAWTSVGVSDLGIDDQTKYWISPRFYDSLANTVINKDRWDSLEPETQEAITKTINEVEPEIFDYYQKLSAEETQAWLDKGLQRIEFTDADAEKILDIAYNKAMNDLDWDRMKEMTPQAEEIRTKFEEKYSEDLTKAVPGGVMIKGTNE